MQEPQVSCRAVPGATGMQGTIGMVFTSLLLAGLMTLAAATDARIAGAQEPPDGTVEVTYDTAEIEMVSLINGYREENGLDPLLVSETASLAAKRHSEDMARYGFVDHATQQSAYFEPGVSFDERMDASGYDHDTARSENIAAGGDAEEAFDGWRESPSHDENMLDPDMKVIGIGLASSGDSGEGRYSSYWTTDFGGHVDETATGLSEVELEPEAGATENEPGTEPDGAATEEQYSTGDSQAPQAAEAPEEGTTEGSLDGEDGISEERADPGAGGGSNEGSNGGSDDTADETAADDQYSTGDEGSVTEGSEGEDEEPTGDDSEGSEDGSDGAFGGSGEQADRDCDTRADFDKGPFDEGFGSDLSERIRAAVDCRLALGDDSRGGGGGQDGTTSTTIAESTVALSSSNDESRTNSDNQTESDSSQEGNQEAGSGGCLSSLFGGGGSSENSQASSEGLADDSGKDKAAAEDSGEDGGSNEGSNEGSDSEPTDSEPTDSEPTDSEPTDSEPTDEDSRDGAGSVLGPASPDDGSGEAG